jgi:phage gp36-like protein
MYCTQTDLENRISAQTLAQLTNDTVGVNTADAGVVNFLIAKAQSVIDSYLADVYVTPLNPVPATINSAAVDLACYYAYERRSQTFAMPQNLTADYSNAISYLEKLASQTLTIDSATQVNTPAAQIVSNPPAIVFCDTTNGARWY